MAMIREDLALLGVTMDVYSSEKAIYGTGQIESAIAALRAKGLIYEGVLEPPKGKTPDDWEPREQTLFRSTAHGDDVDRPVMKSDGAWTYFAPDIAYHWDKVTARLRPADRHPRRRSRRLCQAAEGGGRGAVGGPGAAGRQADPAGEAVQGNGEPFKMSKRAGTFVTLRDVVEQAGADVTRFVMLTRKNDAPLDFDFAKVLEQSKDNPVFYVQYAHARVRSVLRKAVELGIALTDQPPILEDAAEIRGGAEARRMAAAVEIAARGPRAAPGGVLPLRTGVGLPCACGTAATTRADLRFLQDGDPTALGGKNRPAAQPFPLSFPPVLVFLA